MREVVRNVQSARHANRSTHQSRVQKSPDQPQPIPTTIADCRSGYPPSPGGIGGGGILACAAQNFA